MQEGFSKAIKREIAVDVVHASLAMIQFTIL
jgi:hypothetical protein